MTIKDIKFAENCGDQFYLDLYLPSVVDSSNVDDHNVRNGNIVAQRGQKYERGRKSKPAKRIRHASVADKDTIDYGYESGDIHKCDRSGSGNRNSNPETMNNCYDAVPKTRHVTEKMSSDDTKGAKHPLVIFVHGGGWRRGGKEAWQHYMFTDVNLFVALILWFANTYNNVGETLAARGIACAVVSYPLTELGLPYLLLELFLSYIQCCLVVFVSILPVCIVMTLNRHVNQSIIYIYLHGPNAITFIKFLLVILSLLTNVVILMLFTVKRHGYTLRKLKLTTLWGVNILALLLIIYVSPEYSIQVTCLVTFLSTQVTILTQRLRGTRISYSDQVKVVAQSVKWARKFGRQKGCVDKKKIYLMGHSAGAHLVSLVALDETHLLNAGCRMNHIKGVILVSGVYDLTCMNSPILRQFYLLPTFGNSDRLWYKASPQILAKKSNSSGKRTKSNSAVAERPRFLVMSAQFDFFLNKQSSDFAGELCRKGFHCAHIEIPRTNHFSIITNLDKNEDKNDAKSVASHVVEFISWKELY